MNVILPVFIILATMFVSLSVNNIISVTSAPDNYFDMANARRLVRTETTYVTNQAELKSYEEADIDEYEYSACIDGRTSELCRELDGKTFKVKEGKPGKNLPPMHSFCRSTTLAVLPSEEELDKAFEDFKADNIPEGMDFEEWLDGLEPTEDGKLVFRNKSSKATVSESKSDIGVVKGNPLGNSDRYLGFSGGKRVDNGGESGIINIGHKLADEEKFSFIDYDVVINPKSVKRFEKTANKMGYKVIRGIEKLTDGRIARKILRDVDMLSKQYGKRFSSVSIIDLGDERTVAETVVGELRLNSRFMNSPKAIKSILEKWSATNFIPKGCNSIQYVARHEYFHLLSQWELNKKNSKVLTEIKRRKLPPISNNAGNDCYEYVADLLSAKQLPATYKKLKAIIFEIIKKG